ncbi:hypothetical protein [Streptomyces sp. NPDC096311]|uniref:hypothetical protein n=1 Tax=Streptomyces sp. NPDC096311 TaxID=3366083 RepID=UPI00382F62AB
MLDSPTLCTVTDAARLPAVRWIAAISAGVLGVASDPVRAWWGLGEAGRGRGAVRAGDPARERPPSPYCRLSIRLSTHLFIHRAPAVRLSARFRCPQRYKESW